MLPVRAPRRPRMRIGPEIGTAMRLVSTPTRETWSKVAATTGEVATWAARETAMRLEIWPGGLANGLRRVRSTRDFRGLVRRRIPKTAATESWKPVLYTSCGLYASTRASIVLMKCKGETWRPKSGAARTKVATTPARMAEGGAPAIRMYGQITPIVIPARIAVGMAKILRTK